MIEKDFADHLISQFGSPLYVYDLDIIEHQARTLFSILPANSQLFYSLKANPLPGLGRVFCQSGCRAEVSSTGELSSAIEAGFVPADILYSGPGKTEAEIEWALASGVNTFSCESFHDLLRLEAKAFASKCSIRVLLRVNPTTPPQAQLAMTGVPSQFGFEEDNLVFHAQVLQTLKAIEIIGFHVYFGTQIACEALIPTIHEALETALRLSKALNIPLQIIDVGGGFPWPYAVSGKGPDLSSLRQSLSKLATQSGLTSSTQLWFESGRYLVAPSGTLLATVLAKKETKAQKKFVILDSGINHLGGMAGLGRILRPTVSVELLGSNKPDDVEVVDIVGPLCSPLDCLARNIKLPALSPGDIVCIPNVGAYGLTASLTSFLSRSAPQEITYRGQEYCEVYQIQTGHKKHVERNHRIGPEVN